MKSPLAKRVSTPDTLDPNESGMDMFRRYLAGDPDPKLESFMKTYYPDLSTRDILQIVTRPMTQQDVTVKPPSPSPENSDLRRYVDGDTSPYVQEAVSKLYPGLSFMELLALRHDSRAKLKGALAGPKISENTIPPTSTHPPKSNRQLRGEAKE